MALKLRRQAEMITNENLSPRSSRRHPDPLGTGAGSFKRMLDSALIQSESDRIQRGAPARARRAIVGLPEGANRCGYARAPQRKSAGAAIPEQLQRPDRRQES